MPGNYVDNAMNRGLGRVGMPRGSMPHSTGSGSSFSCGSPSLSFTSYGSGKTYADNASNQQLGRAGLPFGSMPISKSSNTGSTASGYGPSSFELSIHSSSPVGDTYVDNASNRRIGRAGLPMGSMPISKCSNEYTDNSFNRIVCKPNISKGTKSSASPHDLMPSSSSEHGSIERKTYADNAFNRKAGRVGLPVGSRIIPTSEMSRARTESARPKTAHESPETPRIITEHPTKTKVYADNASNRKLERVGLPLGTKIIAKPEKRIEKSEPVVPKSSPNPSGNSQGNDKVYVDNVYNRRHDRVGLPLGSAKLSKKYTPKVYVDNPLNRSLRRDGKQIGEAVFSRDIKYLRRENYIDNSLNRQLDRVGLPRGSRPVTRKCTFTKQIPKILDILTGVSQVNDHEHSSSECNSHGFDDMDKFSNMEYAHRIAECQYNRMLEEDCWKELHQTDKTPKPSAADIEIFTGAIIPFSDLKLRAEIGIGAFGEVFYAEWQDCVVAVKKLKADTLSKNMTRLFEREMIKLCELDHPTIIKFIGACTELPDICIVMEYMDMSLFDAIHVHDEFELTESVRLEIMRQTCDGLLYLHTKGIAHGNLKPTNILLNYDGEEDCEVKITDFGITMIKHNTWSSKSAAECMMQDASIPRYSAPEILRGEMLKVDGMMKADIYSLALIFFEIIYEEEAHYDLSYKQLQIVVGEAAITPRIPTTPEIDSGLKQTMKQAWGFSPLARPTASQVLHKIVSRNKIYIEKISRQDDIVASCSDGYERDY